MRKGFRIGPAVLRLMIALFVLAVLAVAVRELPTPRGRRKRKSK